MNPDNLHHFIQDHQADFDSEAPPAGLWDRIEGAIDADDGADTDSDPLREFIVAHRENFDDATPPPRTAERLFTAPARPAAAPAPMLRVAFRRKLVYALGVAASVLLLVMVYHFGNQAGYRAGQDEQLAHQLENIDPELAETERFYQQKIATEFAKVSQVNDDPQLRRDLQDLDAATAQLRAELLEVPLSQRPVLINELIEAYRTKLDILLRIQQHFSNPNPPDGTPRRGANEYSNES